MNLRVCKLHYREVIADNHTNMINKVPHVFFLPSFYLAHHEKKRKIHHSQMERLLAYNGHLILIILKDNLHSSVGFRNLPQN